MRLFVSSKHERHWIAQTPDGWMVFPAEVDGWHKRMPARGLDPVHLREIPRSRAFNTGMPGVPERQVQAFPSLRNVA